MKCVGKFNRKLISGFLLLGTLMLCRNALAAKLAIVTEHLAPFQIVNDDSVGGLSTEIVEAVLKAAGYEYVIEAHPWSLSFNRAKQEPNTCIYSLAYIPSRQKMFQWIGHITKSSISLYSLASNPLVINKLDDAKQYSTAVIRDDVTHHFLLNNGFVENENMYVVNNYDSLLKLLDIPSRNIDLVVLNSDLLNSRLASSKADEDKYKNVFELKELTLDFNFACSLQTAPEIVEVLKDSMDKLEQQGELLKIRAKWQKNMKNLL